MLKAVFGKLFGDPCAFRRVDYPGFSDRELPKTLLAVDRKSPAIRRRLRLNRQIRREAAEAARARARR